MKKRSEALGRSTVEQVTVSRELVASGDDVVLYMSTTRDLWKFPIVDQAGNQVGSLDIWASSSCGEDCVQKGDGRDLWWFTPDHEPFNVLTYSARAPEDFNPVNRIMVGEKVTLGPNEHMVPYPRRTTLPFSWSLPFRSFSPSCDAAIGGAAFGPDGEQARVGPHHDFAIRFCHGWSRHQARRYGTAPFTWLGVA
jgi:hypothetical protein